MTKKKKLIIIGIIVSIIIALILVAGWGYWVYKHRYLDSGYENRFPSGGGAIGSRYAD